MSDSYDPDKAIDEIKSGLMEQREHTLQRARSMRVWLGKKESSLSDAFTILSGRSPTEEELILFVMRYEWLEKRLKQQGKM